MGTYGMGCHTWFKHASGLMGVSRLSSSGCYVCILNRTECINYIHWMLLIENANFFFLASFISLNLSLSLCNVFSLKILLYLLLGFKCNFLNCNFLNCAFLTCHFLTLILLYPLILSYYYTVALDDHCNNFFNFNTSYFFTCYFLTCHFFTSNFLTCIFLTCTFLTCRFFICNFLTCNFLACNFLTCTSLTCHYLTCYFLTCNFFTCYFLTCT